MPHWSQSYAEAVSAIMMMWRLAVPCDKEHAACRKTLAASLAQVTAAAPFNLRSDARHAAAEQKLAARQAEVTAAAKQAASFKVALSLALAIYEAGNGNVTFGL